MTGRASLFSLHINLNVTVLKAKKKKSLDMTVAIFEF